MNRGKDKFGLLVRCDPKQWKWWEKIPADGSTVEIDWTCRLKPGSVELGTPVFLLGTGGSGFIATGASASEIRMTDGEADSSWVPGHKHRAGRAMRMLLKLQRDQVSEDVLRSSAYAYLIKRQSTFTWLTEEETFALENLLG